MQAFGGFQLSSVKAPNLRPPRALRGGAGGRRWSEMLCDLSGWFVPFWRDTDRSESPAGALWLGSRMDHSAFLQPLPWAVCVCECAFPVMRPPTHARITRSDTVGRDGAMLCATPKRTAGAMSGWELHLLDRPQRIEFRTETRGEPGKASRRIGGRVVSWSEGGCLLDMGGAPNAHHGVHSSTAAYRGASAPLFREWQRSSEELALYPCGGTTGSEDSIR